MATRDVFSAEELEGLRGFPEVDRPELIRFFTLTVADEAFVRKFRGQGNVLGAAVQLCTLPWFGFVPDDVRAAPVAAVARVSERLGIPVGELRFYGERDQTRTDHLREIVGYAGWRTVDDLEWKALEEHLFSRAMEHNSPWVLFRLACPVYRRKISRQLNKGESLHALRRDLHYAPQGTISRTQLVEQTEQTEQAWCLTVLTNSVVAWMTEYYTRAVLELRSRGRDVSDEILSHIPPGHSDNINFFGVINVDVKAELAKLDGGGWRPLRPAQLRQLGLTP